MTTREFYEAIINGNTITAEMQDIARKGLASLEKKNEKAKEHRLEKKAADAPIIEKMLEAASEFKLTSVLATECGVNTPKASALARRLVEEGRLVEMEVKVPKVGTRKAYKRA